MADASSPTLPLFYIKDCALVPIATGKKARTLVEFCEQLKIIPAESLYYHFWRQSIETSLVFGSFHNDFAQWAHVYLHDDFLAERLALLNASEYADLEILRLDAIKIVENRIAEKQGEAVYQPTDAFHFIKSNIVVFNSPYQIRHPKDLLQVFPLLSGSSLFYHFIDARRRNKTPADDFTTWLQSSQAEFSPLIKDLQQVDPYFISLDELKQKLISIFSEYFEGRDAKGGCK